MASLSKIFGAIGNFFATQSNTNQNTNTNSCSYAQPQPDPSQCQGGTWQPLSDGYGCIVSWQCVQTYVPPQQATSSPTEPTPILAIVSNPPSVASGQSATILWASTPWLDSSTVRCVVAGPNGKLAAAGSIGQVSTGNLTHSSIYIVGCIEGS